MPGCVPEEAVTLHPSFRTLVGPHVWSDLAFRCASQCYVGRAGSWAACPGTETAAVYASHRDETFGGHAPRDGCSLTDLEIIAYKLRM